MKFLVSSGCYGEIAKTLIFCLINQDRFLDRSPLDRLGKLLLIVYSAIMRSLARQAVRRRQEVVQIRRQKVAQTPFQGV